MENTLNKKEEKWIKLMRIGAKMGCHQRSDRSFSYKGYQFPVCARCIGVIAGNILVPMFLFIPQKYRLTIAFFGCFLMFIDWYIQYKGIKESTNLRRLVTGIIAGASLLYIYIFVIINCINLISKLI